MSLLLDALKRAEQEKLTRQADRPAGNAPAVPAAPIAPALELQPIASAASGASAGGASPRADSHAAQTLFNAKGGEESRPNRGALWAILGAIIVVVLAASAYVWYSLHSLTPRFVTPARTRPAPLPPPAAAMQPPKVEPMTLAPAMAAPAPMSPLSAPVNNGLAREPANANGTPSANANGTPSANGIASANTNGNNGKDSTAALDRLLQAAAAAPPPVRLERSVDRPRTPPQLTAGYDALVAGDLAAARRHYAAALANDEASVDAHLGMATIDAREGRITEAAAHYKRALDLDAHNATALAGLAALSDDAHPEAVETELRADLARYPDSAALQVALGNLCASQGRWSEAQDAYFEAHRLDPGNADVMLNLAVSLDHLGQTKLAADFYRRALAASRQHPTQFDPAPVARRLAEMAR